MAPHPYHHPINQLEELLALYTQLPWNIERFSNNPSITENIIRRFNHKRWHYTRLSRNPAISFNFIVNHPSTKWNCEKFTGNPSLEIDQCDKMIKEAFVNKDDSFNEKLAKFIPFKDCENFACYENSMRHFILHFEEHRNQYLQYNRYLRKEFIQNPLVFMRKYPLVVDGHANRSILLNSNLDSNVLYGMLHMIQQTMMQFCYCDSSNNLLLITNQALERGLHPHGDDHFNPIHLNDQIVELIGATIDNEHCDPNTNCISLNFLIEHGKTDLIQEDVLTNPSIIQSLYKMYTRIQNYYNGNVPQHHNLYYQQLIDHVLHLSCAANIVQFLILKTPLYHIYYEDSVMFTQDHFIELDCLDNRLLKFSNNPHFDWEVLADWTWKEYDYQLLSSNPFEQHVHYRKSQILYELEDLGIFLEWNSLTDLIYDDFNVEKFISKMERLESNHRFADYDVYETETMENFLSTTETFLKALNTDKSKRFKLL